MHFPERMRVCQAVLCSVLAATPAGAAELMPPAQQNALVQKYCAVCHTDAASNGGLSLEHFNAAQAPPDLTAMLLSKLTGGVLLQTAREAGNSASAAAFTDLKMRSGAISAAGLPIPDKATINALVHAFAVESEGATDWSVRRGNGLTASVLRELPSAGNAGEAESYRLIASCNAVTHEGELQLAWAPMAQSGRLAVSVDGKAAVQYPVEGSEAMGNGSGLVLHGLAALVLAATKRGGPPTGVPFPAERLTITDLFPGNTVSFSFAGLPDDARREFMACFPEAAPGPARHQARAQRR